VRAVRVTLMGTIDRYMFSLAKVSDRMKGLEEDLATGRAYHLPSDNPMKVARALRWRNKIGEAETYLRNVDDGLAWLTSTETALASLTSLVSRARDLALQGASDTVPATSRQALAREVAQIVEQAVDVANSRHANRYLFGGRRTMTQPFLLAPDGSAVSYQGENGSLLRKVGEGVEVAINLTGGDMFPAGSPFQALIDLRDALLADDGKAVESSLAALDQMLDHLITLRAEVGARMNRLEAVRDRLEAAKLDMERMLEGEEGVDLARLIVDFRASETTYRAALATGARILQPTLVDFLL